MHADVRRIMMNIYQRWIISSVLCVIIALLAAGVALAQFTVPANYPSFKPDPDSSPLYVTLENEYIACRFGIQGNVLAKAVCNDADSGGNKWFRGDKVPSPDDHNWGVAGRFGVVAKKGDPESPVDDDMPLNFMGFMPCHYFGYLKLRIGDDMRMIGDGASGSWLVRGGGQPVMTPTLYPSGEFGPYIEGTWRTTGGNGSTVHVKMRVDLVRDMVRFEYQITNMGPSTENIGFEKYGDVEMGAPIYRGSDVGGYYGPYENQGFAFIPGIGATQPVAKQKAMVFGGRDSETNALNPAVPNWVEFYDQVYSPGVSARNVLGLEDATKPDMVAIGEHNDLYHKDLWLPLDYRPDKAHQILDMAWLLCWDQKMLAPSATRTIVTYYGIGAATSKWTYQLGKNARRDDAMLSVQAPRSLKYDSVNPLPYTPEYSPSTFAVKAYVYNLSNRPGPYELLDVTASISLPDGLELVSTPGNEATQRLEGIVERNTEAEPIQWTVRATGDYVGELPIYVTVVDNDPASRYWQQTVVRPIYIPAAKRGHFDYGWQLMHVPFLFNNPYFMATGNPLGLIPGTFGAQYFDAGRYKPLDQLKPGRAFWIFVSGLNWNETQLFSLSSDAAIVGESLGMGKQTVEQSVPLKVGWNLIGNPYVYPIYWGQTLVHRGTEDPVTLEQAVAKGWIEKALHSWNPAKQGYDIIRDTGSLLNPWLGYWLNAKKTQLTLTFRPPVLPGGDVTANPGGQ